MAAVMTMEHLQAAPATPAARHIGPHPRHAPSVWQDWLGRRPQAGAKAAVEVADVVASAHRLVVVAPHPDDELLACGLLLQAHAQQGGSVLIVGVTDGEASHVGDPAWPAPAALAAARRAERLAGLRALGVLDVSGATDASVDLLGLPDGGVTAVQAALSHGLQALLRPGDVVVSTWRFDGHPDHEACGRAAAGAASAVGAALWEAPVWMWHWADPSHPQIPFHRLRTLRPAGLQGDVAVARKAQALACHRSQRVLRAGGEGPVLDEAILQRAGWPFEVFFAPE